MDDARDSLGDLERHRLRLEDNIKQLRKSLQHWLTWDAEYEALKEEVEAVADDQALQRIHEGYEGELLRHKELDEIFGLQAPRSKQQIVNVLQRRIDYVTQNVESLKKQLGTEEERHVAAATVSQPDTPDEDGEPITDIVEQLDDDDNVISVRLSRPGDSLPRVQEALGRAGVEGVPGVESTGSQETAESSQPVQSQPQGNPARPSSAPKHSVAASEDATAEDASASTPRVEMSRRARRIDQIMKTSREQESISKQEPVIPVDEDPEDAALRRQMLQYGMSEVGAVVAELQLEGGDEHDDEDEDMDDVDEVNDDDEEDRYGRSTGRLVPDDYRQRMLELEKKLGIKSRFTQQAADSEDHPSDAEDDEGIGRILVKRNAEAQPSSSKPPPAKSSIKDKQGDTDTKKGVRFAQNLHFAPDDDSPAAPANAAMEESEGPKVNPLSDVVERSGQSSAIGTAPEPQAPRQPSRFKMARNGAPSSGGVPQGPLDAPSRFMDEGIRAAPSWPEGVTLAERLVEREPGARNMAPDELDDSLSHGAVADEHQRLRKRFIQRQGGFLREDTTAVRVLDDAEEAPEPISRFKAARLSRQ